MHTRAIVWGGVIAAAMACTGCASHDGKGGPPSATNEDVLPMMRMPWRASAISGEEIDRSNGAVPTFQVREGGCAGGSGGLNHWGSTIDEEALARGEIRLGEVMTTLMAGPPEAMAVEARFLAALKRVASIDPAVLKNGTLRMLDEHGVEVLRFVPLER